jgi:hypothetical protein
MCYVYKNVCMYVRMCNAKWSPTGSLVHLAQIILLFRHHFERWQAAKAFLCLRLPSVGGHAV